MRPSSLPGLCFAAVYVACGGRAPDAGTGGVASSSDTGEPAPERPTDGGEPDDGLADTSTGTDTGATTGAAETGSSGDGAAPPVCGDGQVDPGEQCDHGEAINSDHEFCTDACRYNICGDGLLFVDHEDCDQGAANSDAYGSFCTAACEPGAWCGDNVVQPGEEQCDHGPDNGADAGDGRGIACDAMCEQMARRIFITSHAYTGNLGGLSGADEKCRQAALDGGLPHPERFMALLSDAGTSMKTRYEDMLPDARPYIFVTGMKIADSYADLIKDGPGALGLHIDEAMNTLELRNVATNTQADGSIHQQFDLQNNLVVTDCDGWTTDAKDVLAWVGLNSKPLDAPDYDAWKAKGGWVSSKSLACNTPMHLYCIEL